MRRKDVTDTPWNGARALLTACATLLVAAPAAAQVKEERKPPTEETKPVAAPKALTPSSSVDTSAEKKTDPPAKPDVEASDTEATPKPPTEVADPNKPADEPPKTTPTKADEETQDQPKDEQTEDAPASNKETEPDDPYAGLDHTGTPPLPPPEEDEAPEGEWDESYDGRPKKRRAEDTLIWIPRAPLLPAYLVLNYGVRWPIVAGLAKAEEAHLFNRIEDFFTFADGQAGLYPIGFYDIGRGFWGGGHFFFNDLGVEGHSVRATAGVGTNNWVMATATDSWSVFDGERGTLNFTARYVRDPTFAFTGIGPDTDIDDQSFFAEQKVEGRADIDVALEGLSRFSAGISYKHARLSDEGRDPSLEDSVFAPFTDELTGFDEWFNLISTELRLELDSREPDRRFTPGSGLRLETWGAYSVGIDEPSLSFFRYGTRPGVLWDITGANHVLSFTVHAEALSTTGGEPPPLNELVSLGGSQLMKGFLPGRLRGESALVYSAAYQWPILSFADALLFTDLGTTYLGFYDDFDHDKMVLDWGTGLRTSLDRNLSAEILVAWGTNQAELWNEDFTVDNVRFIAGVGRGF